jgi:hypothetical protein
MASGVNKAFKGTENTTDLLRTRSGRSRGIWRDADQPGFVSIFQPKAVADPDSKSVNGKSDKGTGLIIAHYD